MKFSTINPATGVQLQEYQTMSNQEALQIVQDVHEASEKWRELPIAKRSQYFLKLAEVLKENSERYGKIMTQEMGKIIKESVGEVKKCGWLAEVLVEKAEEWLADEHIEANGEKHIITYEPLGALFLIMPWNFPFWQPFKVALPHIIAGNTVVLKHAKNVTGSALAVEEAFKLAGFPNNVFRTVITDYQTSNDIIAADEIKGVSFTGSTSVGAKVAAEAGKHVKKLVLELGGSDPFIVLADADLEKTVKGAVLGRNLNAGQVCIGAKRFIVHKDIAEAFSKEFARQVGELIVGDPMNEETDVGALVNTKAVEEMQAFVDDAVAKGATIAAGTGTIEGNGAYFQPIVLTNTSKDMQAVCEETFGPVAPIIIAENEEEMIAIANNTEYGLSATVWTQDLAKGQQLARKIRAGSVFINAASSSHPLLPIGGIKKSGYGKELSKFGIKEFVDAKAINVYK